MRTGIMQSTQTGPVVTRTMSETMEMRAMEMRAMEMTKKGGRQRMNMILT